MSATAAAALQVTSWKAFRKNTLLGFFDLTLPSGMIVHGCSVHERDGERWIGLPAQKFTKADGSAGFTPVIDFTSKEARQKFQEQALAAIAASGEVRP